MEERVMMSQSMEKAHEEKGATSAFTFRHAVTSRE